MTPKEVIELIIFEQNTNANKLSKKIGISSTNLYDIMSGKIKYISNDLADKIVKVYEQYSKSWLLTGEGDAHVTPVVHVEKEKAPTDAVHDDAKSIADVKQIVLTLTAEISAQRETYSKQISDLIGIIDKHLTSNKQ